MSKAKEAAPAKDDAMPMFYSSVAVLNSGDHGEFGLADSAGTDYRFASSAVIIGITAEEFAAAATDYPIVFTTGDKPVPAILTGMPNTSNTFIDDTGAWREGAYVPAYVRRYPFMLARSHEGSDEMTLCIDAESSLVTRVSDRPFFEGNEATDMVRDLFRFCGDFEVAAQRTEALTNRLRAEGLLVDAELTISHPVKGDMVLNGFQMVSVEKLRELPEETILEFFRTGVLDLVSAHLLSLRNAARLYVGAATPAGSVH